MERREAAGVPGHCSGTFRRQQNDFLRFSVCFAKPLENGLQDGNSHAGARLPPHKSTIEESEKGATADYFIHQVAIRRFFDQQSRKKFKVQASDGILFAAVGKNEYETDVYFRGNGAFQHEPVEY